MFVVRPKAIRSTPSALAADLGCQTRFYPNLRHPKVFDYTQDFLMAVVEPTAIRNAPPEYVSTYQFATRNKYGQRKSLKDAGIPAPATASTRNQAELLTGDSFVVRPLRHSGGRDYRVTQDRLDFLAGQEYISELYPKRREYRVIFLYGNPLIYLRKKPNEGVPQDAPWGHTNSRFQTINDIEGCRLSRTDCVQRLSAFGPVRGAHIVAADVLYAGDKLPDQPYAVLELNFCPGLDIDNNRTKIAEEIRHRRTSVP